MMIPDYFDCTVCGNEVDDPRSASPECVVCKAAECDACVEQSGRCVPCA